MTHKFNPSVKGDLMVDRLKTNGIPEGEENEMLTPVPHNGKDQFYDLPEAITEQDIMHLREKLQKITGNRNPVSGKEEISFELGEKLLFEDLIRENSPEEINCLPDGKPLPRIHLHHHRRVVTENQHQFYLEQLESGSVDMQGAFDQDILHDIDGLEDALKETDVMNLRDKLKHLSASSIQRIHSAEDIEHYLNGEFTPEQSEAFEADMELDALLSGDVGLFAEVDEALMESDILAMREKLERVSRSEHSSSRSLLEAEAYLEGDFSEAQAAAFENDLFEQRDLRAEVNLLRNLEKAVKEQDIHSLRDKLRHVSSQAVQEGKKTGSFLLEPHKTGKLRRNGTYAALFLVLVGCSTLLYYMLGTAPPGYDDFFPNPQTIGTLRSIDEGSDAELLRGFEFLNKQEFAEALTCFGNRLQKNPEDQAALFYSGFTCQKLNRHREALYHFGQITGAGDNMFFQQAGWYSILSKFYLSGKQATLPHLDAIINKKGYYYKDALALKMIMLKENE